MRGVFRSGSRREENRAQPAPKKKGDEKEEEEKEEKEEEEEEEERRGSEEGKKSFANELIMPNERSTEDRVNFTYRGSRNYPKKGDK